MVIPKVIRKIQNIVFLNLKYDIWFFIRFRNVSDLWNIPNIGFSYMNKECLGRRELVLMSIMNDFIICRSNNSFCAFL